MSAHIRPPPRSTLHCCHNSPFLEHAQSLSCIPQPDEIFRNIRDLPPLKASGQDEYHALFFQKNWHNLGLGVIQIIQEIFFSNLVFRQHGVQQTWSLSRK